MPRRPRIESVGFIDKELFELLDIAISEEEWGKLATLQKTKYTQENKTIKREKVALEK